MGNANSSGRHRRVTQFAGFIDDIRSEAGVAALKRVDHCAHRRSRYLAIAQIRKNACKWLVKAACGTGVSGKANGVDWGEIVTDTGPCIAAILRKIDVASRGSEAHHIATRVEGVPVDDVVGVLLGKSGA